GAEVLERGPVGGDGRVGEDEGRRLVDGQRAGAGRRVGGLAGVDLARLEGPGGGGVGAHGGLLRGGGTTARRAGRAGCRGFGVAGGRPSTAAWSHTGRDRSEERRGGKRG